MTTRNARYDAAQHVALGRVAAVAPAPDGTWLAVAVERLDDDGVRHVSDLWRVPLAGGDAPSQLTVGDTRDASPCFRADGGLAFLSDRPHPATTDGDEEKRSQVWILPAAGGEPRPLTDEPLGVREFRFARAARRLVVLADVLPDVAHDAQRDTAADRKKKGPSILHYTAMPVRFWDHWLPVRVPHLIAYDGDGGGRVDLTPEAGEALRETTWDVSDDGRRVAATWAEMNPSDRIHDRPLAVIDIDSGARRMFGLTAGTVHGSPRFSPDASRIAVMRYTRTTARYGPKTLWTYALDGGAGRELTAAWDRWPTPWGWRADGQEIIASADDEGQHRVFSVSLRNGAVTALTSREVGGAHTALSVLPGGDVCGIRHAMLQPPEPFRLAVGEGSEPEIVARLSGFDPALGAEIATVRSAQIDVGDQREVQAFIVTPTDVPEGHHESFMWIHGGPVSSWVDGWHWRWSPLALAAQGYTVVLPNPAGSTGFGQAWVNDVWGNVWGGRCYEDLMGLVDGLAASDGLIDSEMVVMGGSFGGYMTNWIGANTARFRLLVTHASIFSMSNFYGVTDMPSWWSLMMGDTPYLDPVSFDRYSPARRVSRWQTPTLILHGDRDYRVPIGEALELFEALQFHGVASELAVFPDENHWILKPRNVVAWYETVLDFVARHWDL